MNLYHAYQMHSQFAAAFAAQQMIDRDAGLHELAIYGQKMADSYAHMARYYHEKMLRTLAK